MNESAPQQPPASQTEELELKEYQAITPEQEEAIQRIADIDERIRALNIIIKSVSGRYTKDGDRFDLPALYSQEKAIGKAEDELESAYVDGEDTGTLKDNLASMRAEHEETSEFYKSGGDSMFNDGRGRHDENRLRGKTEDQYSEETEALIATLEELGFNRGQFIDAVNEGSTYDGIRETLRVESVLGKFRSELMLQRNTERLALPSGVIEMSAELTKSLGADKIDYRELLYPQGEHRGPFSGGQVSVSQLFEVLPFKKGEAFTEYPTEVQERFFTGAAKRVFTAAGKEAAYDFEKQSASLGKDLSELRIYGAEQFRQTRDINFDIEKTEKVLEYANAEEEYLRTCLKADKKFSLEEKGVNDYGWRYDPDRPEESEKSGLTWPVPAYEIRAEEDRIKYAGNTTGQSYRHTGGWRNAMSETLAALKAENPYKSRGMDPLDIIIALRKTRDRIQVELETVQLEREQLEMHTQYLQQLKNKEVILTR